MPPDLELAPDEAVAGRPFADPGQTSADERSLRELLRHLRERARQWGGTERDVVATETDARGRRHLLVVPDVAALLAAENPIVVGFFGSARLDADAAALFGLEEELVAGMREYASQGLLSYYDVELVKGAYGNLILFTGPGGPEAWRSNPVHARAVEISPANYEHIRLHQGFLDGRLGDGGTLHVRRTRYLDYTETPEWRAVRPRA